MLDAYSPEEQRRRAALAAQAKHVICESLLIEAADESDLTSSFRGFYLQISFSELHPLVVFCLARKIWDTESPKQFESVNELNLQSVLGTHTINPEVGCYAYRAVHWLDAPLTKDRLFELLDRYQAEALKGYNRLRL